MCDFLTQKLINTAEKLNWLVAVDMGTEWEFQQNSPAGDDFFFSVWSNRIDDVAYKVHKYARDFNPEKYAKMRIQAAEIVSGISDISTLLNDAEDIQEMLSDLAAALIEVTEEVAEYA